MVSYEPQSPFDSVVKSRISDFVGFNYASGFKYSPPVSQLMQFGETAINCADFYNRIIQSHQWDRLVVQYSKENPSSPLSSPIMNSFLREYVRYKFDLFILGGSRAGENNAKQLFEEEFLPAIDKRLAEMLPKNTLHPFLGTATKLVDDELKRTYRLPKGSQVK